MPLPRTRVVHPNRASSVAGTLAQTRPFEVEVRKPTRTKDSAGGSTEDFTTETITCARVIPINAVRTAEREMAERLTSEIPWFLALDVGVEISVRHQLREHTTSATKRTWSVVAILGPHSYEAERRVLCIEVK